MILISFVFAIVVFIVAYFVLLPFITNQFPSVTHVLVSESTETKNELYFQSKETSAKHDGDRLGDALLPNDSAKEVASNSEQNKSPMEMEIEDAIYCFKYLLVFNAACKSFAHGMY